MIQTLHFAGQPASKPVQQGFSRRTFLRGAVAMGVVGLSGRYLAGDTYDSQSSPANLSCSSVSHHSQLPAESRFAVMGDTGWARTQRNVSKIGKQMAKTWQQMPFNNVLMLGDNIYNDGNVDKWGMQRFVEPFQALLNNGVRFIAALGNHDTLKDRSHVQDQINFPYWHMPATYYTETLGPNNEVQLFVVDTTRLNKHQMQWLDTELGKSTAPFKIVAGHHPARSSTGHGVSTGEKLLPLLEKHKVPLYLAGHQHSYERFRSINGVTQIISGGGGAPLRRFGSPAEGSLYRLSQHHFIVFEILPTQLHFSVINKQGSMIDCGEIIKPAA